MKSVKIKSALTPGDDLSDFDPGSYLKSLEFYETDEDISELDRIGLADFLHFLAYLALKHKFSKWTSSLVPIDCSAYAAIRSHFSFIDGWYEIENEIGINYKALVCFLIPYYKPGTTTNA